jgi:ATP-dependent DNA helicase RecG
VTARAATAADRKVATKRVAKAAPLAAKIVRSPWSDALASRLAKIGLHDQRDCVLHLPLRYEDETRVMVLGDARDGELVQVDAIVVDHGIQYRPRRQLVVQVVDANARDEADAGLTLRFINFYGSQVKHFEAGTRLRIRGEVRGGGLGLFRHATREMIHPRYSVIREDAPLPDRLTPVYPSGVGLGQVILRRAITKALEQVRLDETLPAELLARYRLPAIDASIRLIHNPPPEVSQELLMSRAHPAWQRIKFDELLAQQLSLAKAHAARRARTAPVLKAEGKLVARFMKQLPFALTDAQARVVREIEDDLARPHPMQRLLQGDVGSGKTVVAAIAALHAIDAGYQAVLMAPTEILAEQHFRKLAEWIEMLGVPVAWLTGSLKKREKASARDAIESGIAKLAIGTHALIQEDVHFARLGLAIVDEQHRFGVGQRLALRFKARTAVAESSDVSRSVTSRAMPREPHQLMMSATPIPRTLAMTYFADLDVSTIDQLPPGRKPIVTKLVDASRRDEVIARVRSAIAEGRQAYWVCPLVESAEDEDEDRNTLLDDDESLSASINTPMKMSRSMSAKRTHGHSTSSAARMERLELKAAVETHEMLTAALPEIRIGLVHGRLSGADKGDAMRRFNDGELGVLVATTVIEVGVDVPNASLMVIEHAERFGLAQLHQLRGRVGRGPDDSVCILMFQPPLSLTAKERLKTMHETQDGFAIAKKDLELRGPGEFLGHRQSGEALLRFADLQSDQVLVDAAREAAVEMLAQHPREVERHLQRWLRGAEELLKA